MHRPDLARAASAVNQFSRIFSILRVPGRTSDAKERGDTGENGLLA
jgi:hypothetical protein